MSGKNDINLSHHTTSKQQVLPASRSQPRQGCLLPTPCQALLGRETGLLKAAPRPDGCPESLRTSLPAWGRRQERAQRTGEKDATGSGPRGRPGPAAGREGAPPASPTRSAWAATASRRGRARSSRPAPGTSHAPRPGRRQICCLIPAPRSRLVAALTMFSAMAATPASGLGPRVAAVCRPTALTAPAPASAPASRRRRHRRSSFAA